MYVFVKIHLNIILPSTSWSPEWSLSLRFPHQNLVHTSPSLQTYHMPRQSIILNFITRTILGEEYRSLSSSLCNFLHSPVTPSLLGPNILLNTLFSNTLSLCSSLNVSDQVSHPYKTTVYSFKCPKNTNTDTCLVPVEAFWEHNAWQCRRDEAVISCACLKLCFKRSMLYQYLYQL